MTRGFPIAPLLLAVTALATGCSSEPVSSESERFDRRLVSADVPTGWDVTERRLSNIVNPRQILNAASFDLSGTYADSSCTPERALDAMPPGGALISVQRYEGDLLSRREARRLHRRPDHFRLDARSPGNFECSGRSYAFSFSERGIAYGINVWLDSARVDPEIRAQTVELLDGLELRPGSGPE